MRKLSQSHLRDLTSYLLEIKTLLILSNRLKKMAKARRGRLEDAKALFQLWEDHEEEEAWLVEKKRICQTGISAKDLRALISLQQKHKVLERRLKQCKL